MFRQIASHRSLGRACLGARCFGRRTGWSRSLSISARADSKLAPCVARPNLFSGD